MAAGTEGVKDFDYINSTYQENFGVTKLNVFFEGRPSANSFWWYFKRYGTYFLICVYLPSWITIQVLGLLLNKNVKKDVVYFQICSTAHASQIFVKLLHFVRNIDDFRSLCLRFDKFHTARHRPIYARRTMGDMSAFLRKLSTISFNAMYINYVIWTVTELILQPALYLLHSRGIISVGPKKLIPKPFPLTYPFGEESNPIAVLLLEIMSLHVGIFYALPMDLFYVTVFMLISAEMDLICKSAETAAELGRSIVKDYSLKFGPEDDKDRIDLNLLIKDHQRVLEINQKIRRIMNPILGLEMCYFIVTMAMLALTGTAQMKHAKSFSDKFKQIPGLAASILSIMSTLYLYSWICGRFREAEEDLFNAIYFTNWYERSKKYRDALLIVMGRSFNPRPLRMLSSGNMDRETFITGLKGIYSYYNFMANME